MTVETKPATMREWLLENLELDCIRDLGRYGAQNGFPGLTYYRDTVALYEEYHDEIWDRLYYEARDFGHNNVFEMIAQFGGAEIGSDDQFKNLLVWYMAEAVARELDDEGALVEDDEEAGEDE